MTAAEPLAVTDAVARATAETLGLGEVWSFLRDQMVAAGEWKIEECRT